jgi:hypothetical protein
MKTNFYQTAKREDAVLVCRIEPVARNRRAAPTLQQKRREKFSFCLLLSAPEFL